MADLDLTADRERWIGTVFQEIELTVDADRMLEWAIAAGETDPRFVDPTHPDFQASPAFPTHITAARNLPEDFPEYGTRGIDGGKSIEWHRSLRAGQRLRATAEIGDLYAKTGRSGTMVFIVNRMSFYDDADQLVCVVDWRQIRSV